MAGGARLFPDDFGLGVTCLERPAQTERCVESLLATTPATKIYLADDGSQSQAALELLHRLAEREGVEVLKGGETRGPSTPSDPDSDQQTELLTPVTDAGGADWDDERLAESAGLVEHP